MSEGKSLNFGFDEASQGGGGQGGTSFEDLGYSPFDAAETYAKDDVVIYNGSLYKFTASHTGAWDDADATPTSVEELIKEGGNGHSPYIGENGNWFEWDKETNQFVDTEAKAQGPQGEQGPAGPQGEPGEDGQDGADAVNPFKGWYKTLAELKAAHTATEGDSAYVKDASPATTWSIYVYDATATSDNFWADSGTDADTSNVQTFATGEEVNEVGIDANPTAGSKNLVKSGGVYSQLYDTREYGTLNGYIKVIDGGSTWIPMSGILSKYIKVRNGDTIRIVKNSEHQIYCAFITSIDTSIPPIFANWYSGVIRRINEATLQVLSECYLWWLVDLPTEHWEPSVLTLNGQDILNETYSVSRISEIQESFDDIQECFGEMVGTCTHKKQLIAGWGTPIENVYWNLVDGKAGLVTVESVLHYFARPTLYPVVPGMKMVVTVKNSYINDLSNAAFSGYDNDGLPAYENGTVARQNFSTAISMDDNEDGTTTYTFILGSSVTQVGLFYKGEEITFFFEQNESFAYSPTLDSHIREVAGGGATTSGDSARYYLKGSSPKSFSSVKKICILAAGQSNIDGRVPYADMPAEIQAAQPIANCHYVKNSESGAFSSLNISENWAFDLVTYYNIALAQELYVIKWSQGGTSIDPFGDGTNHWTADYEKLASESNSLLLKFEKEIRNHIASNGENFDIRAMLWHQGESDRASLGTGSAGRYYDNLRNMISYVRGIVGNERLPIVTGTINENSVQYDATVHAAQVRLATEDPYFVLIDMSGAPLLDNLHFNAASSIYFGKMAYNALIDLGVISGTKLTPTRPW